jgi:sec-independent protein translocase protein TatA
LERLGPVEIGLILVIVLIVFGVGKLPQVGGALGKGILNFRQALKGEGESPQKTSRNEGDGTIADKAPEGQGVTPTH